MKERLFENLFFTLLWFRLKAHSYTKTGNYKYIILKIVVGYSMREKNKD